MADKRIFKLAVLVGGKPVSFLKKPHLWLVKAIIQLWQKMNGYKNYKVDHCKIVMYPILNDIPDDYVVFEFTFPKAEWSVIPPFPEYYRCYEPFEKIEVDNKKLYEIVKRYNGRFYDVLDLVDFLKGKRMVTGISNKWLVCSTGIQQIFKELGYDFSPHMSVPPAWYADNWDEVKN